MVLITIDIRRSYNVCYLGGRIIAKRIRSQCELRVHQFHFIIENRHLGSGTVFSPIRCQYILFVHQGTSIEKVTQIGDTVVVQAIGCQGSRTILHADIVPDFGYLCITIIEQIITVKKQSIPLLHLHIIKCFQGIGLFIEASTITIHIDTIVPERHIAYQDLCIRVRIVLALFQHIRMKQVNLALCRLCRISSRLYLRNQTKAK